MRIDARELERKLSEYLARAAAGEEIVVTDRCRPVARLVPFAGESHVERSIREGWIEAPRRAGLPVVERVRSEHSTSTVLDEDRTRG